MRIKTFFEKFELFADAPGAVAKIRELILDVAVRGRLVDQDPSDEPATALLQRLVQFKLENPLTGRSGRTKEAQAGLTESNVRLPTSWVNTTIGDVLYVIRGASPRPKGDPQYFSESRTAYHWVKISDIREHGSNGRLMDTDEFLTEAGMRKSVLLPKGTLVLTNSATICVPIVIGIEGCCIHDGYLAFPNFPHDLLNQKFLLYLFHTLKKHAEQNARGLAQLNLNTDLVRSFPFGLPPFTEQKRIVAKVDELMALCDRLEAKQQERETRHKALVRASLTRFAEAPTPTNLNYLFHPSYPIRPADLRRTILALAVQGKLVPQDHNDEPVSELLERLVSLTAEGGKVPKSLLPINAKALPFELPLSWEWVQAQDLCRPSCLITYGVLKPVWVQVGVPTVRVQDMQDGIIVVDGVGHCSPERAAKFGKTTLEDGDLLIAKDGATLGKTAFVPPLLAGGNITQHVLRFPMTPHVSRVFIRLVIDSPHGQAWMRSETKGVALPGVNVGDFRRLPIPLPPLAEQSRIVAKVDELMAKVDALEAQLSAASTTATSLLDAIVAELTNPATVRTDTNSAVLQNESRPLRKAVKHKLTPPRTSLS